MIRVFKYSYFLLTECTTQRDKKSLNGGHLCVFPFVYKGVTYDHCTDVGYEGQSKFWCATKVDENQVYISGNWGWCNENCPTKTPNTQNP